MEFVLFSKLSTAEKCVSDMLKLQYEKSLITSFPNVNIAFRIYLSIFGTSCEGKRSFSKLKLVKNYLGSTLGQQKPSSLALISTESKVLRAMNVSNVIANFAARKCRQVQL